MKEVKFTVTNKDFRMWQKILSDRFGKPKADLGRLAHIATASFVASVLHEEAEQAKTACYICGKIDDYTESHYPCIKCDEWICEDHGATGYCPKCETA